MFVLVAFYFGWFFPFDSDLYMHYVSCLRYFVGLSWSEILEDPRVFYLGTEMYHVILKYLVSRVTDNPHFFGGVCCGIYAAFFIFFFRQLKTFYLRKQNFLNLTLLLVVVLTVEFRWFQGVRYWPGVFVFLGFYLKFVNSKNYLYLLGCLIAPFFHITLLTLIGGLALDYLLKFTGKYVRLALFGLSLFVRSLNVDFVPWLLKIGFLKGYLKLALFNQDIRANDLQKAEEYRELHNFYYAIRPYFGILIGLIVLFFFYMKKATDNKDHVKVLTMALTMFTIANFGYGDIIFYDRFNKVATLIFFVYLYMASVDHWPRLRGIQFPLAIPVAILAFYFALTVMVELRANLYDPNLVFGNFFRQGADMFKQWGKGWIFV